MSSLSAVSGVLAFEVSSYVPRLTFCRRLISSPPSPFLSSFMRAVLIKFKTSLSRPSSPLFAFLNNSSAKGYKTALALSSSLFLILSKASRITASSSGFVLPFATPTSAIMPLTYVPMFILWFSRSIAICLLRSICRLIISPSLYCALKCAVNSSIASAVPPFLRDAAQTAPARSRILSPFSVSPFL